MQRKKLIDARRKAKLSQQEVADKIKASREAVSQWERAIADPQPTHVRVLCDLLESDICMGLADAYAQCQEEMKALKTIERSKIAMPANPKVDPSYNYADCVLSDCYLWEGKMYIDLNTHFPGKGYAQKAYDALSFSDSLGAPSDRTTSETSIYRADAARGIGDMDHCFNCLRDGLLIALEIGSKKRQEEAKCVLQKVPVKWHTEQRYEDLTQLLVPGRQ